MGTLISTICGFTYPLHYLPILRETWLVIIDENTILMAFVVTNVILNSIFSPIAPVGAMKEIMVAILVAHPGIFPIIILLTITILLPTQKQTQIQSETQLETFHWHLYRNTFIQLTLIRS